MLDVAEAVEFMHSQRVIVIVGDVLVMCRCRCAATSVTFRLEESQRACRRAALTQSH
jgi:hypothetical protein